MLHDLLNRACRAGYAERIGEIFSYNIASVIQIIDLYFWIDNLFPCSCNGWKQRIKQTVVALATAKLTHLVQEGDEKAGMSFAQAAQNEHRVFAYSLPKRVEDDRSMDQNTKI